MNEIAACGYDLYDNVCKRDANGLPVPVPVKVPVPGSLNHCRGSKGLEIS